MAHVLDGTKPPFGCVRCAKHVTYEHRKHRMLDWDKKVYCSHVCRMADQKGKPKPRERGEDPPPKVCEWCGELFYFDRAKHLKPSAFLRQFNTCSKGCRYKVVRAKSNPQMRTKPDIKCIREDCNELFRAYGNKKHCSKACAGKTETERRYAAKLKRFPPKPCEGCGITLTPTIRGGTWAFKRKRYCAVCHKKALASWACSHEMHMAKAAGAVRRMMAGEKGYVRTPEHQAAITKAQRDPIVLARRSMLARWYLAVPRDSF